MNKNSKSTKSNKAPAKAAKKAAPVKKAAAKKVAAPVKKVQPKKKAVKAPTKPAKTAPVVETPVVETAAQPPVTEAPVQTPPVQAPVVEAPAASVQLPKDKPAPASVELQQEEAGKKRYVSKTDPTSKYHLRDRSEALKPVGIVRVICEANPTLERKAVILLCIEAGVNKNTAATQFSLWKAKKAKEAADAAKGDEEGEE